MKKGQVLDWNPGATPTFWVNHASRALMRRFEERLRPLGFGMAYLPVVMALEERGPLSQKELLAHARIEQPTMAALLTRMERDEIIVRKPDPFDARSRLIALTPQAKAVVGAAAEAMKEVVDQAMAGVSEKEQATLIRVLRTVVQNLGGPAAPGEE
jgi:DNA-binding MarR family transcriptional regulator